jgi:predicted ArsR family transcriptional regulator
MPITSFFCGQNTPKKMPNNHLKPWARGLETLCLKKLKEIGGTGNAREIAQCLDQPLENISPRLNALAHELLVRDTGRRESAGRGRPLIVWTVTDLGWDTFTGGQREQFAEMRAATAPPLKQACLL